MNIQTLLTPLAPLYLIRVLAIVSALMLIMAMIFQYGYGLHPCIMCYWQRIPHGIVVVLGIMSFWPALPAKLSRYVLACAGISLLIGVLIAAWHSGVELKLLPGPSSCSGTIALDGSSAEVLEQLLKAPAIRCDEVSWSLLGLSMASWNGIMSLFMAIGAGVGIFANRPKNKRT